MINYSRRQLSDCKRMRLEPHERAIADLLCLGWQPMDAYIAIGKYNPALSDSYNKQQLEKLITDDNFTKYMESKQRSIKRGAGKAISNEEEDENELENIELLDKEAVLKEMLRSAMKLPVNDINRINILQKYSDLLQMKKDEVVEEDTTVHFYLPLQCKNCSLFMESQKKKHPDILP